MHPLFRSSCGLLTLCAMLIAGPAWSHGSLKLAAPAPNAQLDAAPAEVRLQFSEALEPSFSAINVKDSAGTPVNAEASHVDAADRSVMSVGLPQLKAGAYGVYWSVVTQDGHRTKGSYGFTVK